MRFETSGCAADGRRRSSSVNVDFEGHRSVNWRQNWSWWIGREQWSGWATWSLDWWNHRWKSWLRRDTSRQGNHLNEQRRWARGSSRAKDLPITMMIVSVTLVSMLCRRWRWRRLMPDAPAYFLFNALIYRRMKPQRFARSSSWFRKIRTQRMIFQLTITMATNGRRKTPKNIAHR